MNRFTILAAFVLATTTFTTRASAQTSVPLFTTTYEIQIEWSYWQNPEPSWMTIDTFDNRDDAELMLALYELALDQNQLGEILGITGLYVIFDVRLQTVTEFNDLLDDEVANLPLRRPTDVEKSGIKPSRHVGEKLTTKR